MEIHLTSKVLAHRLGANDGKIVFVYLSRQFVMIRFKRKVYATFYTGTKFRQFAFDFKSDAFAQYNMMMMKFLRHLMVQTVSEKAWEITHI